MGPLDLIDEWPVSRAAAAFVAADGALSSAGDIDQQFELASVTKLATALAVLVAVEEGSLALDQVVTEAGATVSDLLAHIGGLAPDSLTQMTAPRTRRVYSTAAYDLLGDIVAEHTGLSFARYLSEAVFSPLGMGSSELLGAAGAGVTSTVRDLVALASAWRRPGVIHESTLTTATRPIQPELGGVLPGFGRFDRNLWGLGPEIRGDKQPHWTGHQNSPTTFGHFGRAGTMMWVDPTADCTLIALSDEPFGPWALASWPELSDAVLATVPGARAT